MESTQSLATQAWTSDLDLGAAGIEILVAKIDLVTEICKSALLSADSEDIESKIRDAKKWYANALRSAGKLSFSVQDVEAFESRTVRLEEMIVKLERRCALQNANSR